MEREEEKRREKTEWREREADHIIGMNYANDFGLSG